MRVDLIIEVFVILVGVGVIVKLILVALGGM
jgi:hypothetical protein